jgi:hypothetical protein
VGARERPGTSGCQVSGAQGKQRIPDGNGLFFLSSEVLCRRSSCLSLDGPESRPRRPCEFASRLASWLATSECCLGRRSDRWLATVLLSRFARCSEAKIK